MGHPAEADDSGFGPLVRLVSGGQSGVDRGALDAALTRGFPCGGWCPAGRLAEDGPIPDRYPLSELESGGYLERTLRNVADSDGTLIIQFGAVHGGTRETLQACRRSEKPCLLVDGAVEAPAAGAARARAWIRENALGVLNVAGPRLSDCPGSHEYAYALVDGILSAPWR